jgi:hypothetical protein
VSVRSELLRLRSELDRLLERMPDEPGESRTMNLQHAVRPGRYMKVPAYAELKGLSARTIRDYCDLGMPSEGVGRGRRVIVAEADAWLASGGPSAARMARKGAA